MINFVCIPSKHCYVLHLQPVVYRLHHHSFLITTGDETPGLHAWDRAVAYYAGSLSSAPGTTSKGNLLYSLANQECSQFQTCSSSGSSSDGRSVINTEILDYFRDGQGMIKNGDCDGAKNLIDSIVPLMTIPLIQGSIRYAHLLSDEPEYWEPYGAQAAAFASSVLPLVHQCDPNSAQVIHDNLKVQNNPKVDFVAVKRALEKSYPCLKVSCQQVGGIYNPFSGGYIGGTEPCTELFGQVTVDIDDDDKSVALGLFIAVATLVVLGIVVCLIRRTMEKRIIHLKNQQLEGQREPRSEIL
jgi:hypothetical protein